MPDPDVFPEMAVVEPLAEAARDGESDHWDAGPDSVQEPGPEPASGEVGPQPGKGGGGCTSTPEGVAASYLVLLLLLAVTVRYSVSRRRG
jgi:hypothetical protein